MCERIPKRLINNALRRILVQSEHRFWNLNSNSGKSLKSVQFQSESLFSLRQNQCSDSTRMGVQVGAEYAPKKRQLEVEAMLQNKDIGFFNQGQEAEIKVDAFNFTKYGVIPAKIVTISEDAVEDKNLGWAYKIKLTIERSNVNVKNKIVELTPGMTVNAKIKTGKRRVIEFFLSPLLRGVNESIRER